MTITSTSPAAPSAAPMLPAAAPDHVVDTAAWHLLKRGYSRSTRFLPDDDMADLLRALGERLNDVHGRTLDSLTVHDAGMGKDGQLMIRIAIPRPHGGEILTAPLDLWKLDSHGTETPHQHLRHALDRIYGAVHTLALAAPPERIVVAEELAQLLDGVTLLDSGDGAKFDLELTCDKCKARLCDAEHSDSLLTLVERALVHACVDAPN